MTSTADQLEILRKITGRPLGAPTEPSPSQTARQTPDLAPVASQPPEPTPAIDQAALVTEILARLDSRITARLDDALVRTLEDRVLRKVEDRLLDEASRHSSSFTTGVF